MSSEFLSPTARRRVVLVAVDASENALHAFRWYMRELHRQGDYVVLCHVRGTPDLPIFSLKHGLSMPVEEWQKSVQEQLDNISELKAAYEREIVDRKIHRKFLVEQSKHIGQGLIDAIESENAEMCVIGTRGLNLLRRTLLGSVSDYVVRQSKVPVIVCPQSA